MYLQLAGGVVDPVGADVHAVGLLAQRVGERIAHPAESWILVGTAREDDLSVRAVGVGDRGAAWGCQQAGGRDEGAGAQPDPATG